MVIAVRPRNDAADTASLRGFRVGVRSAARFF